MDIICVMAIKYIKLDLLLCKLIIFKYEYYYLRLMNLKKNKIMFTNY